MFFFFLPSANKGQTKYTYSTAAKFVDQSKVRALDLLVPAARDTQAVNSHINVRPAQQQRNIFNTRYQVPQGYLRLF